MCNPELVNLTALSHEAADDVTWVLTAPFGSQLELFDYFCV